MLRGPFKKSLSDMSSEQPLISRATLIFTEVSSRIAVTAPFCITAVPQMPTRQPPLSVIKPFTRSLWWLYTEYPAHFGNHIRNFTSRYNGEIIRTDKAHSSARSYKRTAVSRDYRHGLIRSEAYLGYFIADIRRQFQKKRSYTRRQIVKNIAEKIFSAFHCFSPRLYICYLSASRTKFLKQTKQCDILR